MSIMAVCISYVLSCRRLEYGSEGAHEQEQESIFLVYSVRNRHEVIKSLSFSGSPSTFVANEHFIVIVSGFIGVLLKRR